MNYSLTLIDSLYKLKIIEVKIMNKKIAINKNFSKKIKKKQSSIDVTKIKIDKYNRKNSQLN